MRRARFNGNCRYWSGAEVALAVAIFLGWGLVLALLYRLGLWPVMPFVCVALALGVAWAITPPKGSGPGLPPPPIEPAMKPVPRPLPPVRRSGSKDRGWGGSLD